MERIFGLKAKGTTFGIEVVAGITTFFAMAYIVVINSDLLSAPFAIMGDTAMAATIRDSVFIATCLAACIGTLLMGFYAKMPFAQAPGMDFNAYFAYTLILTLGYTFRQSLAITFIAGLLFTVVAFTGMREMVMKAIPTGIQQAIAPGIGLFIALLGLERASLIAPHDVTFITMVDFSKWSMGSSSALLALIGLILLGTLCKYRIKGAILISILATTVIGIPMGVTNLSGFKFTLPNFSAFAEQGLFKMDFVGLFQTGNGWATGLSAIAVAVITLTLVIMYDCTGTLLGCTKETDMMTPEGTVPGMKRALKSGGIGVMASACLGSSPNAIYVESRTGITEGGKTGLTSVVTSLMFIIALFAAPIISIIPPAATAPALILVSVFMLSGVKNLDFTKFTEAIPAFLTIVMMPFTSSIANGIAFGLISFVLLKLLTGKVRETNVLTWATALLFILRFIVQ